jgi:hypothetical protein
MAFMQGRRWCKNEEKAVIIVALSLVKKARLPKKDT